MRANIAIYSNSELRYSLIQQHSHVWLVGWLVFNGTFSTNRLYRAMYGQEINPTTYTTPDTRPKQDTNPGPSAAQASTQPLGHRGGPFMSVSNL